MRNNTIILFILLFMSFFISSAFSQGTLTGIVTDSLNNEALIAAEVYLVGTAIGTVTDINGEYRIDDVPAGTYNLRISYIGYHQRTTTVVIEAGKTLALNAKLTPGTVEGEVIQITAQALGQAAAINQQVKSKTIVNVVSEERIKELPDANAAESVGRLPGVALQRSGGEANKIVLRGMDPRFSSISIDGVRIANTGADAREVDLSTISQRSLAGIELFKALTAEMDADAIAGGLNLVTKKAPSTRLITADFRGSYNALEKSYDQYDFSGKYGERFFDEKLGVQLGGNLERRIRSQEDANADYDPWNETYRTWEIKDLKLDYRDEIRKRYGFNALLDFDTPDGGSLKWNSVYSKTSRDYITSTRNYPITEELFYTVRDREEEISTVNSFIKGDNYLFGMEIDWSLSYAQSNSKFPFDYELNFIEPALLDSNNVQISQMLPVPDAHIQPEELIPYAINNFDTTYLYSAYYRTQESKEKNLSAFLNLSKNYSISNLLAGQIKIGGKYKENKRSRSRTELLGPYYNYDFPMQMLLPDGTIVDKQFSGTRFDDFVLGGSGKVIMRYLLDVTPKDRKIFNKYRLYPLFDRETIHEWWKLNKNGWGDIGSEYQNNQEVEATFYDIDEKISAGYLTNILNYGSSISLITGIRVEYENNEYKSKYSPDELFSYPAPHGTINDTTAIHKETIWLPNFHLTIRPTDFMSFRLAAYRALARPDFNQRLEIFIARAGGFLYSANTLTVGNSRLQAAKAWNYEINTSLYESTYGLFSASAFYKDVKDMFHMINGLPFASGYSLDSLGITYNNPFTARGFDLVYPFNSKKPTRVWGFEIEVQTNLRYLPGFLKNFVVNGNFSFVRSETYIPSVYLETYMDTIPGWPWPIEKSRTVLTDKKQKLEGQPEFFGNLALGYDIGGFSARISVFYQGEYNTEFSPDRTEDGIQKAFTRWDLILKQRITKNMEIFMNINNLTNAKEGTATLNRIQGWRFMNQSETYGLTGDLGLRITL